MFEPEASSTPRARLGAAQAQPIAAKTQERKMVWRLETRRSATFWVTTPPA
jgi:hypothetical protein